MIYTVTLNPALDYTLNIDLLQRGAITRSNGEISAFGGKGINVSLILKELGLESTALGICAGFMGEALVCDLENKGIKTDFVRLKEGNTRINVKIRDGAETDINCGGPDVPKEALEQLFAKLDALQEGDILVLAGSIPKGVPQSIYADIMKRLQNKGILFVVDACGEALTRAIEQKPFLIKPNEDELAEIFKTQIETLDDALFYAEKLCEMGAQNVLVSLGEKGAVLRDSEGKKYFADSKKITPKSTVGAGDSMVAGFLAGYILEGDFEKALKLGAACGTATAASYGLATKKEIEYYK